MSCVDEFQKHFVDKFLNIFEKENKHFWPALQKNINKNRDLFYEMATPLLNWVAGYLGSSYAKTLSDGYAYFTTDVLRSQLMYEKTGKYRYSDYQEAFKKAYDNQVHMSQYHWGVYVCMFAWEHHLKIYRHFRDCFMSGVLPDKGRLLDLGTGSGIWGLLAISSLQGWNLTGVDISETSVRIAKEMAASGRLDGDAEYIVGDALKYKEDRKFDAVISFFLMEHLEEPEKLMVSIADNLCDRGYAYITAALTAAEIDHIKEFSRESEIILMAENCGFRVLSMLSGSPSNYPSDYKYLPRSMGVLLQKKNSDIW